MKTVNLILLADKAETKGWELGKVFSCLPSAAAIDAILAANLRADSADAWLFWGSQAAMPDENLIFQLLGTNADVWHAGLALGLGGKPEMIDFVSPTWMLNRDPDSSIEATSWRLSLRACLVRADVLRQLGGPRKEFETLEGAGLEMGLRYIRQGAFVRHIPQMAANVTSRQKVEIPIIDQLLFIKVGFGQKWLRWAAFRAALTRFAKLPDIIRAFQKAQRLPAHDMPAPLQRVVPALEQIPSGKVSVLIPTLRRYPYLRTLLDQLRQQTVPPFEVLVVDQTPQTEREPGLAEEFADLPIRWYFLDQAGQCSSRNFGLLQAKGEIILFLDDDDEIQPDLIQKHLTNIARYQTNISNGVAEEKGSGALPGDFRFLRVSNVFPTNNTLIRKNVLDKSGLFDLAFDHGQRADHDLGMRLYLAGELMILDPGINLLHHHAPMGGLREHKARIDTYAASRSKVFKQILPSVSDLYLSKRYFTPRQVRERIWITILGTFSMRGPTWQRLLKVLVGVISLPKNIRLMKNCNDVAQQMLVFYPQIPELPGEEV